MLQFLRKIKKSFFRYLAFWLILALLLTFSMTKRGFAQSLQPGFPYLDEFTVSAYYSPLPNQSRYVTGTYDGDVRLNGEGVHSADGSVVYPGMIAAPPAFPFGTKIFIEGLGTGTVHDRGGAIKNKRLDVWMGQGEEGMKRALAWGIRTVKGTVYGVTDSVQEHIDLSRLPLATDAGFWVKTRYFRHDLGLGDESTEVAELQRLLKELDYLEFEPTGTYGEATKASILAFQFDEKIIQDPQDPGAGLFGPRTRVAFEKVLEREKIKYLTDLPQQSLKIGAEGKEVEFLTQALQVLGYLDASQDRYDAETLRAVLRFQKDRGIVLRDNEFGAGQFGPQTREHLKNRLSARFTPDVQKLEIPDRNRFLQNSSSAIFTKVLQKGDRGEQVERLQEELFRLNFLRIEPTGYFGGVTEHAVFKFQQAMGIVETEKDSGAGLVGPRTRDKLSVIIAAREDQNRLIAEMTDRQKQVAATIEKEREILLASTQPVQHIVASLSYGTRGEEVRQLQQFLQMLGYFPARLTSDYFGDTTRNSLVSFQKAHGIIQDEDDESAGVYDEKTKRVLRKLIQG